MQLDHELGIKQVTEKIARTENPRHRQMLEVVREHLIAENASDIERVMATLTANPVYHTREPGGDKGPKGRDGVRAYYQGFFAIKGHFFECDFQYIAIDDDCVITEAIMRMIKPGRILGHAPFGPGSEPIDSGAEGEFDPSAHYLLEGHCVVIWPFDDDLLLVGEDGYSGGSLDVRKLSDDELPDAYTALLARS